jgi:MinD superfamily P-loop ATPase
MILSVASGKGGTGKTTVAVNMALSLGDVRLLDCDVEEPNCHIFLKPDITGAEDVEIMVPEIDEGLCDFCGDCARFCQYNALAVTKDIVMRFTELCHSCGGCMLVCPRKAIAEVPRTIGKVLHGKKGGLDFSYGLLDIGESMATPIIKKLKEDVGCGGDVLIDAPPGASCAVIETVKGSDYCLLVTEPTPFGLNDLKLAAGMLESMSIPYGLIINRDGIGDDKVEEYCERKEIPIHLRIPHDRGIAHLYSQGIPFTREFPEYNTMFKDMFNSIREGLEDKVIR